MALSSSTPSRVSFDRQAGQMLRLLQSGQDHRLDDAVDILLRVLGEDRGRGPGLTHDAFQISNPLLTEA